MQQYKEDLKQALRHIQIADHITYVTFPLVNEKRLLLKIIEEINLAIICSLNCMFNYKYPLKNVDFNKDNLDLLESSLKEISKDYELTNEQIIKIKEIFELNQKHKKSSIEFVKKDNVVILSDNLSFQAINIQKIKEYLLLAKRIIIKFNLKIK
ncbi:MAG: hypothetical protein WC979_04570 [Candidatus Pacearchaeota archaeon]|jgi:hypothetical protein